MYLWLTYLLIAVLLVVAELLYFKVAGRFNIVDRPNERSSHKRMVLRGGGIIYVLGVWLFAAFFGFDYWQFLLGITLAAGISFVDDIHSLPDSVRLFVQFLAMALMFSCWGILNWESWWIIILGLILCVGIANAYNFMDGINGINGGYTLALLLPLAWLNASSTSPVAGFAPEGLIEVSILSDLVFCFFNFRPKGKARCFAGDVGSIGAAFIVLFLMGLLILKTGDFTYIVFLAVYGVDSVLTICHRIILRENLGEAHRKHAYQLMANELGMEHTVVSAIYAVLQLLICLGMILIPASAVWHWGYLGAVCFALAAGYLLFMKKYYHLHEEYLKSLER